MRRNAIEQPWLSTDSEKEWVDTSILETKNGPGNPDRSLVIAFKLLEAGH